MTTVLDFAGLTNEQAAEARGLLGGDTMRLTRLYQIPIDNEAAKLDWKDHVIVVIRWGDPQIDGIFAFLDARLRRFQDIPYLVAAVIGQKLRKFHPIAQFGRYWNEDLDDFVDDAEFDPSAGRSGDVAVLEWDQDHAIRTLEVLDEQEMRPYVFGRTSNRVLIMHEGVNFTPAMSP